MSVKIILACAGGFSTSMLVERMEEYAKNNNIDVEISAMAEVKLAEVINTTDIVLLGPQVGHLEESLKKKYRDMKVIINTINFMDYGVMDGEKVLNETLDLYNKEKTKNEW